MSAILEPVPSFGPSNYEWKPGVISRTWGGLEINGIRGGGAMGLLGYVLGGYVSNGSPNLGPVLERTCTQNDTLFWS